MTKKRAVMGVALLAAGLLAGCSSHPGAAAIVNGQEVSEKSIDAMAADLGATTQDQRIQLLQIGMNAALVGPILDSYSDQITPDFEESTFAMCSESMGIGEVTADSPQEIQDVCLAVYLSQASPEFNAALAEVTAEPEVEFSPRYTLATGELPAFLTDQDRSLADISPDMSGELGN